MLEIAPGVEIDESQIEWEFLQASGPGGQNVNKVATAVRLRVHLSALQLDGETLARLICLTGQRITNNEELIIDARRRRSQEANRQEALQRLAHLIIQASSPVKKRHPTRPTQASIQRRIEAKRRRSIAKQIRQRRADFED